VGREVQLGTRPVAFVGIGEAIAFDQCERCHGVRLRFRLAQDVDDRDASSGQRVGDQRSMAAPGHGFSAHDDGWSRGRERYQSFQVLAKLSGLHVVGVATERGIAPGRVDRVRSRPPEATEPGKMFVADSRIAKAGPQSFLTKLRVVSGLGDSADVDQLLDSVRLENADELLDGMRRMPDGVNRGERFDTHVPKLTREGSQPGICHRTRGSPVQETMTKLKNGRTRAGNTLIILSGVVLAFSSVVKFLHPAKAVAYMQFLGYENSKLFLIASLELLIALLFLNRSTRSIGLPLVSGYLGGAIAAHLAFHPLTGNVPIVVFNANHSYLGALPAIVVLSCAWLGVFLRHPESRWSLNERSETSLAQRETLPAELNRSGLVGL
jgi:hypothetical protein